MPILTKRMEKYVLSKTKTGYTKETQSKNNQRIRNYAKKGIEQLALLAENLQEKELREIFNQENLRRFFANVLFRVEPDMDREKRRRILGLWKIIVFGVGGPQFAVHLAPEGFKAVSSREQLVDVAAFIAIRSAIWHEDV